MEHKKSTIERLFTNLGIILGIIILYVHFGILTYRIPMSLNMFDGLSRSAMNFYASILQAVIILLIYKYYIKKENERIKEEEKRLAIDLLDIFIFMLIGFCLKNVLSEGLLYLEKVTNMGSDYYIKMAQEEIQVTNLDRAYDFVTGVILASIIEEILFRKGVFVYLEGRGIKGRNMILISSISFGLMHATGLATVVHAMMLGIILSIIYAITKNIIYPIVGLNYS